MADRPPDDPEQLLENVASLDTARMTLRWALERIRGLERAHAETQELLQKSFEGRQAAEGQLADFKKAVEDRARKLAEKERFVGDMQKVLNDLFKGEVDVGEFVRRRQALDEERASLEAKVRRRLEEAEALHQREVAENSKRLADMEGVYSASLADAQRRFHAELERLEREQAAALKTERERFDAFRAEAHAEASRAADEYQRRLLILEHEYAGKRRETAEDIDRLKARLETEVQAALAARDAEALRAAERWEAERAQLESRLAERETRLTDFEARLQRAEAAYFSREEALIAAHAKEVEALRGRWADESAARQKLLEEANAEIARREAAFQAERMAWLADKNQLRAQIAAEYEPVVEALRERLAGAAREAEAERGRMLDEQTALRRQDSEKFASDLRALESAAHERELSARREADADLEALRKHFDEALTRQRQEARKEVESHASEVQTLRARLRQQQDELTGALEAAERRRAEDLREAEAAAAARRADEHERLGREHSLALAALQRRLDEAVAQAAREREAAAAELAAFRAAENERFRSALAEQSDNERRLRENAVQSAEQAAIAAQAAARRRAEAHEADVRALRAEAAAAAKSAAEEKLSLAGAYEEALRREQAARRQEADAAARAASAALSEAEARRSADMASLEERHQAALRAAEAAHQAALRAAAAERLADLERLRVELEAPSTKDAATQIEEMTRQCRRALEALDPGQAAGAPRPSDSGVVVHRMPARWPWLAAAALVLGAGAFLLTRPKAVEPAPSAVPLPAPAPAPRQAGLSAPFRNVTGLAWQGDALWAVDWKEQALFRLALGGHADRYALPETRPSGLAVAGGEFFVSDGWAKRLSRWRVEGGEALLTGTWPSPGPKPSALFYDGKNLWSADAEQKRVYRHALDADLTVLAAYEVDVPLVGLWADAERFWSADTANRLVHRHRYDDTLTLVASFGLAELDDGKAPLSAFTVKDGRAWLGRDGDPMLLSRPLDALEPRQFAPRSVEPAPAVPAP